MTLDLVQEELPMKEVEAIRLENNLKFTNCFDLTNVNEVNELTEVILHLIKDTKTRSTNYFNGNAVIIDPVAQEVSHRATAVSPLTTWKTDEVGLYRIVLEVVDLIVANDTIHIDRLTINNAVSKICDDNECDDITLDYVGIRFVYMGLHYRKIAVVTPEMEHVERPFENDFTTDAVEVFAHVIAADRDKYQEFKQVDQMVDKIIDRRNEILSENPGEALMLISEFEMSGVDMNCELHYSPSLKKFFAILTNSEDGVFLRSRVYSDGDASLIYKMVIDLQPAL